MRSMFLAISLSAALVGCYPKPQYMRPAPAEIPSATASDATVVFIRPSVAGRNVIYRVLDTNGEFLGESRAKSWFSARVPPGPHMFIAVGASARPMRANLEAGRLYFVKVGADDWASYHPHLSPIAPNTKAWSQLWGWLNAATRFVPAVRVMLPSDQRAKLVTQARDRLATTSTEMLRAEDGVTELYAQ